jgi:hypothetical protein
MQGMHALDAQSDIQLSALHCNALMTAEPIPLRCLPQWLWSTQWCWYLCAPVCPEGSLTHPPHPLTDSCHLQHLEGLPGITGGERSAEEALVGAGINPGTAFPALEVLDLSDCGVRSPLTVDPLRVLPRLRRLLLAGNPLAAAAIQVG